MEKRQCPQCRRKFVPVRPHQLFDRDTCRSAYWRVQQAQKAAS